MARRSAAIRSRSRATVRANQRCRTRTFRFSPHRNGSKSLAMIGFRRGWRSYDGSTRLSNLLRRQTRVAIKRTRGGPEQTLAVVDEDTRLVLLPRTGTSRSEIDWPAEIALVLIARGKKSLFLRRSVRPVRYTGLQPSRGNDDRVLLRRRRISQRVNRGRKGKKTIIAGETRASGRRRGKEGESVCP